MNIEKLYQLFIQYPNIITDNRKAGEGGIFFAMKGERFDANDFALSALKNGANYALVDRADLKDEPNCIWVENTLDTLQELANFHRRQFKKPVLAITGTNGKTTTKELIASVLQQKYNVLFTKGNLNNHIGVPLTLLKLKTEHDFAVVEMGANHPGEIKLLCEIAEPDYGIITNVGKAHLEGFGSFEGVKKTKAELYQFIESKGKAVFVNADSKHLKSMLPQGIIHYTYGEHHSNELLGEIVSGDLHVIGRMLFPKGWLYIKSKLSGAYNFENMLAAARVGLHFGLDPMDIQKGIENYTPTNNRSQIQIIGDTTFLLDCYNANPSSMEVSIQHFMGIRHENKILILGDMLELGDVSNDEHQKIVTLLETSNVENVLLVGQCFYETASIKCQKFANVEDLLTKISKNDLAHKLVLVKGSRGIKLERVLELMA